MKKKQRPSFFQTINNNIFLLKIIFQFSPWLIVYKIIFSTLESFINIASLLYLRYAINLAQNIGSYTNILMVLLIVAVIVIVFQVTKSILNATILPRLEYSLKCGMKWSTLEKAGNFDLSCYDDTAFYKKYTVAFVEIVDRAISILNSTEKIISSLIAFFAAGVLSYLINPIFFIFALLPFAVSIIRKPINKNNFEYKKSITELNRKKAYIQKVFYQKKYANEIRMTNISNPIFDEFKKNSKEFEMAHKKYGFKLAFLSVLESFFNRLFSQYIVLFYAAWQTLVTGNMGYGDCLVIVSVVEVIYESINRIVSEIMNFQNNSQYVDDIKFMWDYKPQISINEKSKKVSNGDVCLKNVFFKYTGLNDYTIKGISFTIHKGEKVALVGPNGAGKTSLIKLLLRLYDPSSGDIFICDENIKHLQLSSVRKFFSVVLQDYKDFAFTLSENILLRKPSLEDEEKIRDALKKTDIYNVFEKEPNEINTNISKEFDENGVELSSGQHQKIAISRIYLNDAPFIILDEPSSALDPKAEYALYQNIIKCCNEKTVLFISHRMSSARLADKIIFMDEGELLEIGSHNELMKKNGKYAQLYKKQASNYLFEESDK